jgi:hypothetical protein
MKNHTKFRPNNESNSRLLKKRKMEYAESRLELEMKKLEVADKIASLLARENDYEDFKSW